MNSASSALIILNGKGANHPDIRSAITQLRERGHKILVRVTWEHGDAKRYVEEGYKLNIDTIVAGGGDGTINEVAAAIAALQLNHHPLPTLGILPLGTANDFATACQIPADLHNALELAINGTAVAIDLAMVNHQHIFINMATGGFGTKITTETPAALKAAFGGFSYLLHGISQVDSLKADTCTITSDGFHWSGEALVIGIGNGKQAGGGHPICPEAKINDGQLQLSIMMTADSLQSFLSSLFSGKDNENIVFSNMPALEITAPHEMILNLDGEPLKGNKFSIEVMPCAIKCRLPPDCPLLI
ncbi:lipid kinase YegS [Budvicia aquatica]|uniref:Probable lipid kinase YegS-like n=1 Tax=Budvicia aquatica TaxID=82979 RepID=A0A2C6DR47_9GAMM|nr:lipid kinase YegS [Budvicia aquatica]PHI30792.1 lipid kinase YegS [Budvicia aquatica]VFS50505.1 Probable lipid kinase YegS [Budvicia aquatica]